MNYLAHSYLSNNNPGLLVGNFIADHISGNNFQNYPAEVVVGIQLHRKIDSFTDSHPKFKESKRFFYPAFEKYSGILVDIYFDYFLASNFKIKSGIELEKYCKQVYEVYNKYIAILPEHSSRFLQYAIKNNIYFEYSKITGIETVLSHLSHRINHNVRLNESLIHFKENELRLKSNFDEFFSDAVNKFLPH